MTSRSSDDRLAAVIDNPDMHVTRSPEDRGLARLAAISRELAAVPRVEPDERFVVGLRAALMATATRDELTGRCAERRISWPFQSRVRLWIVAVLTAGALGGGIAFASSSDPGGRSAPPPAEGPVVPTAAAAISAGGAGQAGGPGQSRPSATPGPGRSATPAAPTASAPPAGAGADPATSSPAPATSPSPSQSCDHLRQLVGCVLSVLP